ncbi:MAG: DUF4430 domain-containing protein [Oscillospiraceae bacterium]|nr:DUF4430 domain-containing protein [Oscillospiraceae bacterium]
MKFSAKILSLLLIALIAVGVTGCDGQLTIDNGQLTVEEKTFILEVYGITDSIITHEITTTEATVGAALLEAEIIDNADFVTYVVGWRADYVEDGYWWAFYIDGDMAMKGVGDTNIEEGMIYAFIYTKA